MPDEQKNLENQNLTPIASWKKHIWLYAGILILLAVGVSVWAVNERKSGQEASEEEIIACTKDAMICPDGSAVGRTGPNCEFEACPAGADTTDWKTYRNEEYGFEFRYPGDWELFSERRPEEIGPILALNFASPVAQSGPQYKVYGGELTIWIWQNPNNLQTEEFHAFESLRQETTGNIEQVMVNGKPAKVFRAVVGNITSDVAIVEDESRLIEIKNTSYSTELLDQILSTFKFIEPTAGGDSACAQVLTPAFNPNTGEEQTFPTPCDVPDGWMVLGSFTSQ